MENVEKLVTRKERRLLQEKQRRSRQFKKGTALVGTTMAACTIATPLIQPQAAEAATASVVSRSVNTSAFIAELAAYAQPVAAKNDLYASVMIAQAVVESGWGQSSLARAPYYNLFGIKGSYQGKSVYMDTQEYLNGKWLTMKEPFRDYPSYQQAFEDNANVIKTVRMGSAYHYRGAWKSNCSSYRDATAWLTGRYATAPHYATALNTIIETYNLTRYDNGVSGSAGGGASSVTSSTNNTSSSNSTSNNSSSNASANTSKTYYTVKSGDSVWLIADKYGISMSDLVKWNNIKNNLIFPGQKVIVKNGGGTSNRSTNTTPSKPANNTNSNATSNNAASQPSQTTNTSNAYYTVKSGDSVWLIADKYGISMSQLVNWNGIKNNLIHPGQKLIVKKGAAASTSTTTSSNTSNTSTTTNTKPAGNTNTATGNGYYTVKSGDSVWLIADKHGISMTDFINWNGIKNNFVYPGQKVIVKKGARGTTSSTYSSTSNTSKTYQVKSGDSLWEIAQKYDLSINQLKQLNKLNSDVIYVGQKLLVK